MRGVTCQTVHNWIKRGQVQGETIVMPFLPAGRYWIVRLEDVRRVQVLGRGRPRKTQITETPADVATRAA